MAVGAGQASLEQSRLDVVQAVNTDPNNFAGVLERQDGSLVVFYVGSNAGRPNVEAKIPPGLIVQWRQVRHSYSDLMRILREIRDRNLDGVTALSIDVTQNQVKVRVTEPEFLISVSITLTAQYGNAVQVIGGSPVLIH